VPAALFPSAAKRTLKCDQCSAIINLVEIKTNLNDCEKKQKQAHASQLYGWEPYVIEEASDDAFFIVL